ncbi:hypothetical protein [Pseudomonas sp. A-B-26]|uniref:hypothetical protein n=1 Tax=Pseudomonas sp. A-B-26 TaxID=2832406 RepID=UPI001CBD13BC|nr:hypothetical protein [Pseudomonas sp. A-B-26]
MHKVMPFLLALALISTTGCASMLDARRDYLQWRDSLGLPRQAIPTQDQETTSMQQQMQMQMQMQQYGQPVYREQDCIGAVVNDVCHGSTGAAQPMATCYGQMLNGQCTGPQF